MFMARSAETVSDLFERVGRDVVVLRRTPDGDVLVSAPPEAVAKAMLDVELSEAFA